MMKMVDVVVATPSMLFPHDPVDYPNIKVIAVAGEVCPQSTSSDSSPLRAIFTLQTLDLADKWARNGTHFYNSCGPTEVINQLSASTFTLSDRFVDYNRQYYGASSSRIGRAAEHRKAHPKQQRLRTTS